MQHVAAAFRFGDFFLSLTDVITCRFAIKMSTGCTALQMRKARNLRKYSHLTLFEKNK